MATTSRLVSRPHRAIISITVVVCVASALLLLRYVPPYYVVHDASFDAAVVDGIASVSRHKEAFPQGTARIVIVPHHLVASETIAEGVARIDSAHPEARRIIIVSPDHYKRCATFACTSHGSFGTFFGDVPVDVATVQSLLSSPLFTASELFQKEHGVYTIVPFIRHYLPAASVVPIVVSIDDTRTSTERIAFASLLETLLMDTRTVLIFSSDFSHYLPLPDAELMDLDTKTALCAQRLEYIRRLRNPQQSDCPLCLWLATTLSAGQETPHPYFFAHTNSAVLLKDRKALETTSHFGIFYRQARDTVSCTER